MAYHTPLTNSQEFTAALQKARELAANITKDMRKIEGTSPDFEVFPYTYVLLVLKLLHVTSPLHHSVWEDSFQYLYENGQ